MVQHNIVSKAGGYWLVLVVSLTTLSSWLLYQDGSRPKSPPPTSAQPTRSVAALGRIEPRGSVIQISVANAEDSRVERLLVQAGDWVKAGQIIAVLQGLDKQQAAVVEAAQNVIVQQAKLQQTRTGNNTPGQITAQQAIIARLEAQLQTESVARQAAIHRATVEFQTAQMTYQRYRVLYREGAISAVELDEYRKLYQTAEAAVVEAQAQLANTRSTLAAQIMQERAALQSLFEVRSVDVQVPEMEVNYALSQLNSARAKLEDFYVRAALAGQILRINTQVGEQVDAEQGIVDLGQTDQMYVIAEVEETDVSKIRVGQRAVIFSENSGLTQDLHGTVEEVGLQIQKADILNTDSATDSNTRVMKVKIRLSPTDSQRVAGLTYMQVRVKIQID
jgi:HlyD family secretion protein